MNPGNAENRPWLAGGSQEDQAADTNRSAVTVAQPTDLPREGLSARPVLVTETGRRIPDLTGETFGLLKAIAYAGHSPEHRAMWDCVCECGQKVTVRAERLRGGHVKSCGCLVKRRMSRLNRTHGRSKTPLYRVWRRMIDRCENEKNDSFQYYGSRGIAVCAEWRNSFEAFERDMGPGYGAGLSIDRINNDRGYSADNCRWATDTEQNRNRRFNRLITFKGETRCVAEWAELVGIKYTTLIQRLNRGWPLERALTRDVNTKMRAVADARQRGVPNG